MSQERDKFEAWDRERYDIDPSLYSTIRKDGLYYDRAIQCRWECWLASRRAALEEAAQVVDKLRDEHCAGTRESPDPLDHCRVEGDDGCEFVAAWNDAASAIRKLGEGA